MATIKSKTFPGVYSQIIDQSFFTPTTSRFKPGLVGVASKGALNVATRISSLKQFVQTFGNSITTTYSTDDTTGLTQPVGKGFFLADAVDAVSDFTDAVTIVRVGNTYTSFAPADGISGANSYTLVSATNAPRIQALLVNNPVWLRVTQPTLATTVNIGVVSAGGGTISLDPTSTGLAAGYTAGQVDYSIGANAANKADGILYAYSYGTSAGHLPDTVYTAVGSVSANKNQFQFFCSANANLINPGDVFKVKETGKATTHEVRVASTLVTFGGANSGTVFLERTSNQQTGYQALATQDNYANAQLFKPRGKQAFLYLKAASEGTWANGADDSQGLYTKILPGSKGGTKKVEVYWNSALVETHDNLTDDPTDTVNYWSVRLKKGVSNYVYVDLVSNPLSQNWTAANTVNPYDARFFGSSATVGLPVPMPLGATNAGYIAVSVGNVQDTGGQFTKGFNGENPTDSDFIGTLDPVLDTMSGIQAFEDKNTVDVNVVGIPMHNVSVPVLNQLAVTCNKINAIALTDVPAALNGRQAIDWHNGKLPTQDGSIVDSHNVAVYWNWFTRSNRFGETKLVPPTIGTLRAMAFTFNVDKPWGAAAGETRGYLPEAQSVQFRTLSEDTRQAMYGNGNSVNPIININNRFFLYGERTLQRLESKLTAVHNVILVNWVVTGMAAIARRFVFEPNDAELLNQLRLAFSEFLVRIQKERGLEQYQLIVDSSNNTADNRNNREVIVDIALIPTDVAERIYINATVKQSGAKLNSIS